MARLFLPFLVGVLAFPGVVVSQAQTSTVTAGPNGVSGSSTVTTGANGKPCKVVHSDAGKGNGSVSSSVTAGPDGVHSSSTGGNSVTTRSNNGATSSSTASSGSGTTMTTTGDGDCVVTVPKDRK
ncbi:hypothetical protein PMNALOAF_2261 [Methylobacterium adhaesivum]|uniref:Glycosyl hydrolase n=1 Tax=Methylobacterium adhaesivum TaxID=333297 RepID=A0ABT8BLH9_9HYPH|nr:glycosyl hydrolase [Methylobacterium adhaesivum]MDN3593067.1 glycosyl hydrolase [Methylobacterium adhaesivum]GJD31009.1 hypothetical protein PMNALOAF_2261 [Methylobacterium adhaesivum]